MASRFARSSGWILAAALCLASAASLRAADEVMLTRVAKKGDVVRHKFDVKGTVAGADFTLSGRSKTEVADVKDNGDLTLTMTDEEAHLTVMGQEMATPPSPPITVRVDRRGRLVDYNQESNPLLSPKVQKLVAMIEEPILPEKAVAPGGDWQTDLDNPAVDGKKVTVKETFVGLDKVGDQQLWKIHQVVEADTGEANPLKRDATYWLDPKDGSLVKVEAKLDNLPTQFGAMNWTETRERV